MPRVAVVGSANMDLAVRTPRFPAPGETLLGGPFATHPGGKGANGAVAAARLRAEVAFVGLTGPDAFGEALRRSMAEAGVDLAHARVTEATPTGVALITVDDEGEDTIVVAPGANALLAPEDVTAALDAQKPKVVLASLEVPLDAVAACAHSDAFLILNPAPAADLPPGLWPRIDLLTPNERETLLYTGIDPVDDAACLAACDRLFARGVRRVALTLGCRGCFLATPESGRLLPPLEVRAVDATGAGDAFNGALAAFLAQGRDLEASALLANVAAALACTRPGAQAAMPTLGEVESLGL